MGLLSKLGQSEIFPECFQAGNEKTLSRLPSGDGNLTQHQGSGQEILKQEWIEHGCLQNQWKRGGSKAKLGLQWLPEQHKTDSPGGWPPLRLGL